MHASKQTCITCITSCMQTNTLDHLHYFLQHASKQFCITCITSCMQADTLDQTLQITCIASGSMQASLSYHLNFLLSLLVIAHYKTPTKTHSEPNHNFTYTSPIINTYCSVRPCIQKTHKLTHTNVFLILHNATPTSLAF